MADDLLRKQVGANIASYRKRNRWTQAHLAERLNYTDKAVSKWERGESMPDVYTLLQLSELFDVTINALLEDPNALPEELGPVERAMGRAVEKTLKRKANKSIILGLSSLLVWSVALLCFVVFSTLDIPKSWIAFIYAIPADAIVLLSLRSAWKDFRWNQVLISTLMWGVLLSIFMTFLLFAQVNLWRVFLLGIPGQLAIFLWCRLFRTSAKENLNG